MNLIIITTGFIFFFLGQVFARAYEYLFRSVFLSQQISISQNQTVRNQLANKVVDLAASDQILVLSVICLRMSCLVWRAGLVQLVSASSPSHQVLGSKPSLCRISAGVRLYFGYFLSQTPLVWEPLALGLPFLWVVLYSCRCHHKYNSSL
jgi:hypothetical protein